MRIRFCWVWISGWMRARNGAGLARSAAGIRLFDQKLEKIQGDALNRRDIEAAIENASARL